MGENVLPDLGIQQALPGNHGINRTEQYPHIFPAQLWRQALQEHSLDMGLFFIREECDIPCHHRDSDNDLQAMWLSIVCSQRFSQGENGFRNFDGRAWRLRRGSEPGCT